MFSWLKKLFSRNKKTKVKPWNSRTVTFGFRKDHFLGRSPLSETHKTAFRAAAEEWSLRTCINLVESDNPQIVASMKPLKGRILGFGYFPASYMDGDIDFDSSDRVWTDDLFYFVALHEIGHALGLTHSSHKGCVMYRHLRHRYTLHTFDVDRLDELYSEIL